MYSTAQYKELISVIMLISAFKPEEIIHTSAMLVEHEVL